METAEVLERMSLHVYRKALEIGLDPFEVIFELVDFDEMNEVASYGGFPTRYPHWRFGMEFEELQKTYAYGLQKIYELVINNDPCYAYLMRNNSLVDQKMVICHVYGHADFFKNNLWFSQTNRKMVDEMANHSARVRRYAERYGELAVEHFADHCLSLENLIAPHAAYVPHHPVRKPEFKPDEPLPGAVPRLRSKDYMDTFVNPPDYLERQQRKVDEAAQKKKKFPEEPTKDILAFLIDYAPLENWQRDVLAMVREEAYYFAPQAMTKLMNEGWATYWHSTLMTSGILEDPELFEYADRHSGTLGPQPGMLNPYKIGLELFRDVEDRWNKGKFGKEYEECENREARRAWDQKLGLGRNKIFEVRRVYNDVTFIDEFLTKEFCEQHELFVYRYNPQTNRYEVADRDFAKVKQKLLFRLTNLGLPAVRVEDGNFKNRGELLLRHAHEGIDLELKEARDALRALGKFWQRPVHVETAVEGQAKLLTFDGENHSETLLGAGSA